VVGWLVLAASLGVIRAVRPGLAATVARVKETSASYPLPPSSQLSLVCLGYRAACADGIWAYVLVAQGLRLAEHRRFDHAARYYDAVTSLDPTYREPYLYVDAVLTFGAVRATEQDARDTRRLLERGMTARPTDAQLYLQAANFLAYIGPGYLPDEEEQTAWRLAGARTFQRASELGAGQNSLQWHSLAGAGILSRSGEREAAIGFLERAYAVTDDLEMRETILDKIRGLKGERAALRAQQTASRFEETWKLEFPFVSRTKILLLGPAADPWECVGSPLRHPPVPCIRDWRTWTEQRPLP